MAVSYSCDGCGKQVVAPKKVGHVIQRDYCETCAPKAEAFIEADEMLLKNARAAYVDAKNVLIATKTAAGFKLPDVP